VIFAPLLTYYTLYVPFRTRIRSQFLLTSFVVWLFMSVFCYGQRCLFAVSNRFAALR